MDLTKIDNLPVFLKLGRLEKKENLKLNTNSVLVSKIYQTDSLKKEVFNKPIIL